MDELLRQILEKLDSMDKRLEHLEKFQSELDTQSFEHIQQHISIQIRSWGPVTLVMGGNDLVAGQLPLITSGCNCFSRKSTTLTG